MVRTKQRARRGCPRLFYGYSDLHTRRSTSQQSPASTPSSGTLSSATALDQLSYNTPGFQNDTTKALPATSSSLSSVPSMFQTPDATTYSATLRRPDPRILYIRAFDETKYRADIKRVLHNDQSAAQSARRSASRDSKFELLTPEQQERKMEKAAKDKLDHRKQSDNHASCKYPVFVNYITPFAYGMTNEGDSKKQLKELVDTQIEALRQAYYASSGSAQRHDDGEDDHEEPPPTSKKEEGGIDRQLSDIKEYVEPHQARPSRGRTGDVSDGEESDDEEESHDEDSDEDSRYEGETIHVRPRVLPASRWATTGSVHHAKAEKDADEDEASAAWVATIPLVAVSRGMPLLDGAAMPALSNINLKQRFATGIRCVEKAVIRGQLPAEDHRKSHSKKRAFEHHDGYGGVSSARKRAKLEMEV